MAESVHLSEVFGVSREVPRTYVLRKSVDERFVEDMNRDKHIVVHGSSKQGKTSLRKLHLPDSAHIRIQCTRDLSKPKMYEMLLKQAGVRVQLTHITTTSSSTSVGSGAEGKGKVPLFASAKAEVRIDHERGREEQTEARDFEVDLNDPNDIVRVLDTIHFTKKIVIEDFHYLDEDVQRSFAFDLKVFHEVSALLFVIIGVWLEANRLILFNGDLSGRLTTIDADKWTEDELRQVVESGATLLNVRIAKDVRDALISGCQHNVGLLQEACYRLCENAGVFSAQSAGIQIGSVEDVSAIYTGISGAQAARHLNFLTRFAEGLSETKLQMYKWIAWVVVRASPTELRVGIRASTVYQRIASQHPAGDTLLQNSVAQALERVGTVQFKHKIQPLILDYTNGRLRVVDATFILFLERQPREELLIAIAS